VVEAAAICEGGKRGNRCRLIFLTKIGPAQLFAYHGASLHSMKCEASMKELWRRTVGLISSYPVLWLPVIWAATLSYGWTHLRLIILHDVLPSVLKRQSVLGGSVADTTHAKATVFYVLATISTNVCEYADVCCFVVALLMTAKMVGRLTSVDLNGSPYADISPTSRGTGALWVGLVTYLMGSGLGAVVFVPLLYYASSVHHFALASRPYIVAPGVFVIYAVLAYFVTPIALRLLARSGKNAIGDEERSAGRLSSLLTGASIATLSFIQLSTPKPFDSNLAKSAVVGLSWTVLVSLPYAPLFIALSLLGAGFLKTSSPLDGISETQPFGEPSLQSE